MDSNAFILLVVACLAVNLTPGPSVMLVTSVSAARGFKAGLFAVLGMTAGAMVHVVAAASGLAAVLAAAPLVFAVLQYLGAAYLIYLAIELFRAKPMPAQTPGYPDDVSGWRYFQRGLLVDLLNPKIGLFFLAFIPQFLSAVETPGFSISLALGSVFLVTDAIVNSSLAWLVAAGANRTRGRFGVWFRRWLPGCILFYLGLRLLWREN